MLDTEKDLERNLSTLIVNSAFTHHTYGHSLIEDNLVINESGSSEEILDIESRIKELVDEDVMNALKNRKNYNILEDERPCKAFLNSENTKRVIMSLYF